MESRAPTALSDRELVTSRLLDTPRERVFDAWLDPVRLARWWGPKGFTNSFEVFEPRPNGGWRFVMHGPNGASYPNESAFREIARPERLVIEHKSDPHFILTAIFGDEGGKTRLTWRMRFDSAEVCQQMKGIVVPANEQNLDRLAAELALSA
jgi:uncharacterized protein YndB with AHSA1/START domain